MEIVLVEVGVGLRVVVGVVVVVEVVDLALVRPIHNRHALNVVQIHS